MHHSHIWAQCGGKLQREFEGAAYDVFARTLRGLAATKLTKPGTFRCTDGDGEGHALRCSFKVRIFLRALSHSAWNVRHLVPVKC